MVRLGEEVKPFIYLFYIHNAKQGLQELRGLPPALGAGVQVRRRAREEQAHLRLIQTEGPQLFSVARIERVLDTCSAQNSAVDALVAARIDTGRLCTHPEILAHVHALVTLRVDLWAILVAQASDGHRAAIRFPRERLLRIREHAGEPRRSLLE